MTKKATVNYPIGSDAQQAFRFDVDRISGNLITPDLAPTEIIVQDLRGGTWSVDFDRWRQTESPFSTSTTIGGRPNLAHSALDMEGDGDARVPRKSIESRTLVRYE